MIVLSCLFDGFAGVQFKQKLWLFIREILLILQEMQNIIIVMTRIVVACSARHPWVFQRAKYLIVGV